MPKNDAPPMSVHVVTTWAKLGSASIEVYEPKGSEMAATREPDGLSRMVQIDRKAVDPTTAFFVAAWLLQMTSRGRRSSRGL